MRYCIAVKTALSPYISTNLHTPLSGSIVLYEVHIRSCISLYNLAVDTTVGLHSVTMNYLWDTWYSYSTVILTSCNETYRVQVLTVVNIFVKYHELNISVSHVEHHTISNSCISFCKFDEVRWRYEARPAKHLWLTFTVIFSVCLLTLSARP